MYSTSEISSVGRALASQAEGREFETRISLSVMFKSYILSIIGVLLGVGAIAFVYKLSKDVEPDNIRYICSFNSATIENRIIGQKLDVLSEKYLPPVSVKKKAGRGNMVAHYEDVKIFTRGAEGIIRQMDVTYKDSVATEIVYGEPRKNMDAKIVNASPLALVLIDHEIFTKNKETTEKHKATTPETIMILIWLLLMSNLPFLFTWPLATFAAKKMEYPWNALLVISLWLLLYWIYLGIAAYAIGTAVLFLVIDAIWLFLAMKSFFRMVKPEPVPTYSDPADYEGDPRRDYNENADPARVQDYIYHIQNLAAIVSLAAYAKNVSEARAEFLTKMAMREGIGINLFNKALSSPTLEVHQPSTPALKKEFIDNLAKIILCDNSYSTVQLGAAITVAQGLGMDDKDFGLLLIDTANNVYHRDYGSYKVLKV